MSLFLFCFFYQQIPLNKLSMPLFYFSCMYKSVKSSYNASFCVEIAFGQNFLPLSGQNVLAETSWTKRPSTIIDKTTENLLSDINLSCTLLCHIIRHNYLCPCHYFGIFGSRKLSFRQNVCKRTSLCRRNDRLQE